MPNPPWDRRTAPPNQEEALIAVEKLKRKKERAEQEFKEAVVAARNAGVEANYLAKVADVGYATVFRWVRDSADGAEADSTSRRVSAH
jgi:transposase-like protein